jgi:predicted ATP-grasp superfamily ATP-dependent carboligase
MPRASGSVGGAVAVVMGVHITGLAVARALGRRGIAVVGASDGHPVGVSSRYVRFVRAPSLHDEAAALDFYLALGRRLDGPIVLVPTGDPGVLFVSHHRETLAPRFLFHVPDADLLEAIASKRRLVAIARTHGLPLPPTILPESREELMAALDTVELPCVIKPEFTHLWRSPAALRAGLAGVKAIPVERRSDLVSWYDRLAAVDPRLIIQKMVIGPDENHLEYHGFIDREGEVRAEFVGRKLRLAPAHYGSGSYVESIHAEDALLVGRAVLVGLGYRGMANLDLKRDQRDGRLYLFEINPRFTIWTALDVACGVDFPYYYYQTCLGQPFAVPASYPAGRFWLNPLLDLGSMRVYARDGTWSWWRWLGSVLRPTVNAVFAWDDPRPALSVARRWLGARFAGRRLDVSGEPG